MAVERPGEQASLHNAELRLVLLLEDLERTVRTAEELANSGHEAEALRIIDLQRSALADLPRQLASEIAPPSARRPLRRLALASLAACFTIAASVATAVVVGPRPAEAEDVTSFLDRADHALDPAARLDGLESAMRALAALDRDDPARKGLAARLISGARHAEDEVTADPGAEPRLILRAQTLAERAERHAPPAPSTAQSPLEDVLPQP